MLLGLSEGHVIVGRTSHLRALEEDVRRPRSLSRNLFMKLVADTRGLL